MYLENVQIETFRSCKLTIVHFQQDLTILAGANNAGKTNVLDALRLLTAPADGRRTRYAEQEDIRRGGPTEFRLIGEFAELNDVQRGLFVTALGEPCSNVATYGLRFPVPSIRRRRETVKFWAGPREGGDPEPEARDLIRHVHFPALRDAQRELASGSPERIASLLKHIAQGDEGKIKGLENRAKKAFESVEHDPLLQETQRQVSDGLRDLTYGLQPHESTLKFGDASLRQLARDLRFFLHRSGLEPRDLSESGLGYANILYLATVLVELQAAKDAELTLFLVEEPEAHLHPQFQAVILQYLREQALKSCQRHGDDHAPERDAGDNPSRRTECKDDDGLAPEGRIQVIVTSHSPHLTSAVSCKHVVVVRDGMPELRPPATEPLAQEQPPAGPVVAETPSLPPTSDPVASAPAPMCSTAAIPIAKLGLPDDVIAKIDRYLNVTRSSLLFSARVMLVEGLSEALLLSAMTEYRLFATEADRKKLARFHAATVVPIDGVDFEPYVRLLLTESDEHRVADRVVVVTDQDPGTTSENRADRLRELVGSLEAQAQFEVYVARNTLEAELLTSETEPLFKELFLELHPRSLKRWEQEVEKKEPGEKRADAFVQLLRATQVRKGDFAQRLAQRIKDGKIPFIVPVYLEEAVKDLVDDGG